MMKGYSIEAFLPVENEIILGKTTIDEVFPALTSTSRFGIYELYYSGTLSVATPNSLETIFDIFDYLAKQDLVLQGEKGQPMMVADSVNLGFLVFDWSLSKRIYDARLPSGALIVSSDRAAADMGVFKEAYADMIIHQLATHYLIQRGFLTEDITEVQTVIRQALGEAEEEHGAMRSAWQGTRVMPAHIVPLEKMAELENATVRLNRQIQGLKEQLETINGEGLVLRRELDFTRQWLTESEWFCIRESPEGWWKAVGVRKISGVEELQGIKSLEEAISFSEQMQAAFD